MVYNVHLPFLSDLVDAMKTTRSSKRVRYYRELVVVVVVVGVVVVANRNRGWLYFRRSSRSCGVDVDIRKHVAVVGSRELCGVDSYHRFCHNCGTNLVVVGMVVYRFVCPCGLCCKWTPV